MPTAIGDSARAYVAGHVDVAPFPGEDDPGDISTLFAATPEALIVGAITRDASGTAMSAAVRCPGRATGTYTGTASTGFPGAVDGWTVTRVRAGVTRTCTQPAFTRNASGAVTARPGSHGDLRRHEPGVNLTGRPGSHGWNRTRWTGSGGHRPLSDPDQRRGRDPRHRDGVGGLAHPRRRVRLGVTALPGLLVNFAGDDRAHRGPRDPTPPPRCSGGVRARRRSDRGGHRVHPAAIDAGGGTGGDAPAAVVGTGGRRPARRVAGRGARGAAVGVRGAGARAVEAGAPRRRPTNDVCQPSRPDGD